ncbi:NFX1-type zinc finger-containing protein 1-like [Adelges cooleyi]|uniref:NFX1-type zinc finger-containing protein 1-like n=1 Tax=Adelges cooleyi TaxID=133065 RepID=UPI0021802ED8|nr:NFX1-type zinc finger-containing protein 1-like [Adelges cooleyi]XP_050430387.1 NFX1-type zinc finger-containing protein 1-like [Adelges cooleyi]
MAEDYQTISATNEALLLTNMKTIISFIEENSVMEMLFAGEVRSSITGCSLTTTVGVEDSTSANFLDYSQLELFSEREPEFLLSFLINNDNFLYTLNNCVDINVLILLMNIFAKIKTLPSRSSSDTDLFTMIEYSKYLRNVKALMVIRNAIGLLSYDQLQEFCFSCMSVHEFITSWESKIILYNIVKRTFLIMKTLYVDMNPNDQVDAELMIERLKEIKINAQVLYDVKRWPQCYKNLSIYPLSKDLISRTVKLSPNIMNGSYDNVEHYLDVQLRLIREDFVAPMREGIQFYKSMKEAGMEFERIPNMHTYFKAKIERKTIIDDRLAYEVSFYSTEDYSNNNSKRFMKESLLVLTDDNFRTTFFATVVKIFRQNTKKTKTLICTPLNTDIRIEQNSLYTMAESDTYFLPYKYTMKVLKQFDVNRFPMPSYIVYGKTNPSIPCYLNWPDAKMFKINDKIFDVLSDDQWPDEKSLDLDSAQRLAFKAALTEEFVVIQGPPGTGKTYIGIKIVKSIIENMYETNILKQPILVVCYTNHALDQFLEGLLTITNKIIRIGGGSQSDILKPYNLKNIKNKNEETLRNAFVVGLTTTGASMRHSQLMKFKPPIVIVEEAAEVLESHVVASLTDNCKHVVLIGDHKQLRPRTATQKLVKQFNFDVSLFERLVKNGFPCHTLETQHRMRPEISSLMLPIYPFLKDHESVNNRDDIRGVTKNVYFIHHEVQEEKVLGSSSYKNMHEVRFIMEFVRYLLRQGYRQDQITVLVTYKDQLLEFEKIRETTWSLDDFRIDCVDGYQGEESDIVLLSLVRSNIDNNIGFLNIQNRVCVALSRAKNGLYIMGNMDNLIHSAIWKKISHTLVNQQSLGNKLSLCCEIHKDWVKTISRSSDFARAQCSKVCNTLLDCGHICKQFCHFCDLSHEHLYRCREEFTKVLSCGLQLKIECWMQFLTFTCPQQDIKKMDPLPPSSTRTFF